MPFTPTLAVQAPGAAMRPAIAAAYLHLPQWQTRLDDFLLARCGDDAAHDISHLRRVAKTALTLAREEGAQPLVVLAAAYFHDIINPPKDHPSRAQASSLSAIHAMDLLSAEFPDFPENLHMEVAHAIEAHSFSANVKPRTIEAKVLQDADRLEALGAIGIARVFYIAGKLGQALFDGNDPLARARPLDDKKYAVDHFQVKLLELHKTMQTASGVRLARENSLYMINFLAKLTAEAGGDMRNHDHSSIDFLSREL